ncbi:MAG: aldehyde dehydrogenase family protein [Candidatus Dormibacteraeota bacterium]|nr:aldehyde dehydrogenase family protein [Candidatus Dormibacteraeota bacterium]
MPERVDIRKTYKLFVGGEFVRSESGRAYQPQADVNAPRGSRKDLRDAVKVARAAFAGWSAKTAMNRGQVLYRAAEMLDGRRQQFIGELGGGRRAGREVDAAVEALVWYAGWTDKLSQVMGTVNPVAGPYFNFTIPEPTGVVGVIAPEKPALSGLVLRIAPALAGGNSVVALASEAAPLPALTLGEVLATSDFPPGVVNLISGFRKELLPWLAAHMDVNAIDASGCTPEQLAGVQEAGAANVKRIVTANDGGARMTPQAITDLMEMKTVWHPIGV